MRLWEVYMTTSTGVIISRQARASYAAAAIHLAWEVAERDGHTLYATCGIYELSEAALSIAHDHPEVGPDGK